ncbi:hypothetical protein B0H11DRAFT_962700 [Mycena galericulata]|nr:hypothetical protein B0H11DRAFT_962700 [Mycena galericulata]
MEPQPRPGPSRWTNAPPIGLTAHFQNADTNDYRVAAEIVNPAIHVQPNFGPFRSITIPNNTHVDWLARVPAHNLTPMPEASIATPKPRKRPRKDQSNTPIAGPTIEGPDSRLETPATPSPRKRPRKNAKRVLPSSGIKWMVPAQNTNGLTSRGTPRGRGRGGGLGRGRGRGGATGGVPHHDAAQLTPPTVVDIPNESATTVSHSEQARPRQWSSSKEELFAIFPELGSSINGVALEVFETPIILLEETNGMTAVSSTEGVGMNLTIVRDFIRDPTFFAENQSFPCPPVATPSLHESHASIPGVTLPLGRDCDTANASSFTLHKSSSWNWSTTVDWGVNVCATDPPLTPPVKMEETSEAINLGFLNTPGLITLDEVQDASMSPVAPSPPPFWGMMVDPTALNSVYAETQTSFPPPAPHPAFHIQEMSSVPGPIPKELQVLIDAYIHCTPILCIASDRCLKAVWGTDVPEEVKFAYLGFHSVVGVQEIRIPLAGQDPVSSDAIGRVRWQFELRWSPGGEEDLGLPLEALSPAVPWWLPRFKPSLVPVSASTSDGVDLSTPHLKDRRLQSHNYRFRNIPIADRCPSILPLHLLVPQNDSTELGFGPGQVVQERKGFYCVVCGKLNRITMMRHRRCSSSFCASTDPEKSKNSSGYSLPLACIRSPHETLPVYLPVNTLPWGVDEPAIQTWPNGMMVLRYLLATHPPAGAVGVDEPSKLAWSPAGQVSARHVFTGNAPSLQLDATDLFESIQIGCELVRETNDSPYFSHTAIVPETTWPECLARAREVIARSIKTYICTGEKEISIQRLLVKGWVDTGARTGTRRGGHLDIRQSGRCAAMMCLGHDLALKIYPKIGFSGSNLGTMSAGMLLKTEAVDAILPSEPPTSSQGEGPSAGSGLTDFVVADTSALSSPTKKTGSRKLPAPFVVTLVHGDILFLDGDNFDYSIVRSGTSILLIAYGE